jgi:type II secretory pathway component PulJ
MTGFSVDRLLERVMVATSGVVLLGAAAVLDDRVRDRASGVFAGSALGELSAAREQVERALQQAADTVGYQSSEHGTLLLFVVAATILFLVMLRT